LGLRTPCPSRFTIHPSEIKIVRGNLSKSLLHLESSKTVLFLKDCFILYDAELSVLAKVTFFWYDDKKVHMSSISATVCINSVAQALDKVKEQSFQYFLKELFIDPISKEITSVSNREKILTEVSKTVTEKQSSGEICFTTDNGKWHLRRIRSIIEQCHSQLRVKTPRDGVLIITLLPREKLKRA
jgi:hypothetical protein